MIVEMWKFQWNIVELRGKYERFIFCMIYVASLLYHRMCVEQCWSIDLTSSGWLDGYSWKCSKIESCNGCALAHADVVHAQHGRLKYCKKFCTPMSSSLGHLS